jgi:hypothetical protein
LRGRGDFLAVSAFPATEAVVHQGVAEADAVFGFSEHHFGGVCGMS